MKKSTKIRTKNYVLVVMVVLLVREIARR